jgi:CubicO group peptidase (beta-lactamase class C family)
LHCRPLSPPDAAAERAPAKAAVAARGEGPAAGWPESSPEAQGLSSSALGRLVDFGRENEMDSVLVVRHGTIVLDAYYAPFRRGLRHAVNSVTKAVTATLVGIAIEQQRLPGIDGKVVELLGEAARAEGDPRRQAMRLEHLLDMTSGIDWKEPLGGVPESLFAMERSADWVAYVLAQPMARAPGQAFAYDSGNSHLLSAILARASGSRTADFAAAHLFAPLGIADVRWRRDPQGVSIGGYGLYLHPRDMARLGQLYLQGGVWQGRQVVPAAWVRRAFQASVDMGLGDAPAFRYSTGWWSVPEKGVTMAVGFNRQLVVVLPALDMVVVATGRRNYRLGALLDLVSGAVHGEAALPEDPAARRELARRVAQAGVEVPGTVGPVPARAGRISGRTYRFERNPLALERMRLDLVSARPSFEFALGPAVPGGPARRLAGTIGLDGTFGAIDPHADPLLVVKATWRGADTLELTARWLSDGNGGTYALRFVDDDRVEVSYRDRRGLPVRTSGSVER